MSFKRFLWLWLSVTMVLTVLFLSVPAFVPYWRFAFGSLVTFSSLCLCMYIAAVWAIGSTNPNNFTVLFMSLTAVRLLIGLVLVATYQMSAHPASAVFAVPFLLSFFSYMFLETYLLTRLVQREK